MKTNRSWILAAVAAGLLASGAPGWAQQWFGCRTGFTLECGNNSSRCVRRARVQPDAACPVGYNIDQDERPGNVDVCQVIAPILPNDPRRERVTRCAPGQTVERRPGIDRCFRTEVEPVNQAR